jgi:hypothetical protein
MAITDRASLTDYGPHRPDVDMDGYDAHVHRELRHLLARAAPPRTRPSTFASIDDLDHALATIAALPAPGMRAGRAVAAPPVGLED